MPDTDPFPRIGAPLTVLVPLDGSPLAATALPYGRMLARCFGARLQTVTVGLRPGAEPADISLQGDPAPSIIAHLGGDERTIVCLSSHGRGGIHRRLIGSVAESLVRHSPAPVVVLGPHTDATPSPPRTILTAVARSPGLERLLTTLAVWAPVFGATIELAHVRSPTAAELYVARITGQAAPDLPDLDRIAAGPLLSGVRTTTSILAGDDPATTLLAHARQLPAPVLLAMDTHRADEAVHHDLAFQLIRRTAWPILATAGA